jgi:hypothetical protein
MQKRARSKCQKEMKENVRRGSDNKWLIARGCSRKVDA